MNGDNPELSRTIDVDLCRKLVSLEALKAQLERRLKKVNGEIEALWDPIFDEIAQAGVKNIPLESGERLDPKQVLFCNKKAGVDRRAAVEALKLSKLDFVVEHSYSPGKLKEWVRELQEEAKAEKRIIDDPNELLPPGLRDYFTVYRQNRIVVYGAKAKARKASDGETAGQDDAS